MVRREEMQEVQREPRVIGREEHGDQVFVWMATGDTAVRVPIESLPDRENDHSIRLIGKIIVINRGAVTTENQHGHAILVGGVLVTEDGCPLSEETIHASTSEQWDVEVIIKPITKRRGLCGHHRGEIKNLMVAGLHDPAFWDEEYHADTGTWEQTDS